MLNGSVMGYSEICTDAMNPFDLIGCCADIMYQDPGPTVHHEDDNLHHHLQRMESSLNMFAEESDHNRLLSHISRMVLEFNRLASKVNKNEMRTSVLQVEN